MKRLSLAILLLFLACFTASAQVKINTVTLPDGYTNGLFYQQALLATISGPLANNMSVTWSLPAGTFLPPGLNLDSSGNITGFPTTTGTFTFTVLVQINFTSYTDRATLSININTPTISILTQAQLPNAVIGQSYQQFFQANPSPALQVQWNAPQASLPPGLTLSPQGMLSGIPQATGVYTFAVTAALANTGLTTTQQFTISVFNGQVQINSPTPLPTAVVGQNFKYQVLATPANSTYGSSGILPFGLTLDPATGILSGVPLVTGIFDFTLVVSSPGFSPGSKAVRMFVTSGPLSILDTSLPIALLNNPYSYTFTGQGGLQPFSWALTFGSLPAGLTLDAAHGIISGRPSATGQVSVNIQLTDATGATFSRAFSLMVAGSLTVLTTSLPPGMPGVPYTQTISAGGGQAPFAWSILSGNTPPGLDFSSSGVFSGTPTNSGIYTFTLKVVDNLQNSTTQTLSITIGGITILLSRLADAGFGVQYSQLLTASGGAPPYTWSLAAGSLPPGLTLNAGGNLAGTPTLAGTYSFTVQVGDTAGSKSTKLYTINVTLPLQLSTTSLPGAAIGVPYTQTLAATGGTPPYTFKVELGALPPGFSLDPSSGVLSGTATAPGPASFGILLTDSGSQIVRRSYTIISGPPVVVNSLDLSVTVGSSFNSTLTATGGTPPYFWSVTNGNLPPGLTLNSSAGIISGSPITAGTYPVTLVATDTLNVSGQKIVTFKVNSAAIPPLSISAPDTAGPAQQPVVGVSLANPYTADVTGTLTLAFNSVINADESSVRFSNGTRSVNFTIPAGSTQAVFTGVSGSLSMLTGTVGGAITLSATTLTAGIPGTATKQTVIATGAPVITGVTFQTTSGGVTVTITGYSTTLEIVSALFHFAATSNATLSQSDFTVPMASAFASWFSNPQRNATGSQFTLTMPFSVQGASTSISSVSASLQNTKGTSATVSPQ